MRICKRYVLSTGLLLAGAVALPASMPAPATALDIGVVPKRAAAEPWASAKEALRAGVRDYNAGDKASAARALEYAAKDGHPLALWKLGRMYADGDGIPRDELKAYESFSRLADDLADEDADSPRAGVAASAFVTLGTYFLSGIKGSHVQANPERAAEMFQYAASYFGDPAAQYHLGRLYLDGNGVDRDTRQAARWFNLAAEKGHHAAQALLGQLLVTGDGIPRQRARGLMWLTLAKNAADAKRESWISKLHAEALESASDGDRRSAADAMEEFRVRKR